MSEINSTNVSSNSQGSENNYKVSVQYVAGTGTTGPHINVILPQSYDANSETTWRSTLSHIMRRLRENPMGDNGNWDDNVNDMVFHVETLCLFNGEVTKSTDVRKPTVVDQHVEPKETVHMTWDSTRLFENVNFQWFNEDGTAFEAAAVVEESSVVEGTSSAQSNKTNSVPVSCFSSTCQLAKILRNDVPYLIEEYDWECLGSCPAEISKETKRSE